PVAADDEANRHAPFEVRVLGEALLVAHAEAAVVLPHDALNDLGRQTPAHLGGAHAHLRCPGLVGAAQTAVTGAEALARAGAGAVPQRSDAAEADTLAATTATFTGARQTEAAGAGGVANLIAPHVAASAHLVHAERGVATPGRRRCVWIAGRARVQQADHAELLSFTQRSLAGDVRIGVVLGALHRVALVRRLGGGVAHRAFFALGARTRSTFLVVGVVLGDLLGLLFLLLALGRGVEVLLDQIELILVDVLVVGQPERRDEERHRRDDAGVREERQAEVHRDRPVHAGGDAFLHRLAGVDGGDLEHEALHLDARLGAAGQRHLVATA